MKYVIGFFAFVAIICSGIVGVIGGAWGVTKFLELLDYYGPLRVLFVAGMIACLSSFVVLILDTKETVEKEK